MFSTFLVALIVWALTVLTVLIGAWVCYFLLNTKSQKAAAVIAKTATPIVAPVVNPVTAQNATIAANQAATGQ